MTNITAGARRASQRPARLSLAAVNSPWLLHVAFAALLALVFVGGAWHEPWFDEAQAWLIARDSDPWTILAQRVHYEGSPALWHLILWAVQRLGLPYAGFWLVSAACAAAGAWLVLYRSPLPAWLRIGFAVSYFFSYQYAVVARSYSLDLVLMPLLALLFTHRDRRPLAYGVTLGVLANANAQSFAAAAGLALEALVWTCRSPDRATLRARLGGGAIYAVLALAAALQAWPPSPVDFASPGGLKLIPIRPTVLFVEALIDGFDPTGVATLASAFQAGGLVLSLLVLMICGLLCRAAGRLTLFILLFGALTVFFAAMSANFWHTGILFLALLFCIWVSWEAEPGLRVDRRVWLHAALAVLCLYHASYATLAWSRDFRAPYSSSRAAAQALRALKAQHPADTIAAVGFKTFSVQPWFPQNVFANYRPPDGRGAFYAWRPSAGVPLYATPANWAALIKGGRYDWLLLSEDRIDHQFSLPPYRDAAARAGYCVRQIFAGGMIWKGGVAEPDTLVLFGRCGVSRPSAARGA
jgi:hypothetical protein